MLPSVPEPPASLLNSAARGMGGGLAARAFALIMASGLVLLAFACPGPRTGQNGRSQSNTQSTDSGAEEVPGSDTPAEAATIAYIGNFRGFQRPCGCDARQDGGLLRLATTLKVLRGELSADSALTSATAAAHSGPSSPFDAAKDQAAADLPGTPAKPVSPPEQAALKPLWLLDCGNFVDNGNRFPGFRAATHLQALKLLDARAAILGRAEAQLSEQEALLAFKNSPLPLLSCNLHSKLDEIKVQPALQLAKDCYLVGITESGSSDASGFASGGMALRRRLAHPEESTEQPAWCSVVDPLSALKATLESLPQGTFVIVACAQLPDALLQQVLALGPDLIIGQQHAAEFTARTENLNLPAALEAPVRRGLLASFVSLDLPATDTGSAATGPAVFWTYRLATGIVDDAAMDQLLKDRDKESARLALNSGGYKENQWGQDESFLPPEMRSKGSIIQGYVGSSVCKDCHPAEYKVWESSGHHHAFQTLITQDNSGTMDCLECHVTGLLEPGGFLPASAQADLAAVGCESCHGPGGEHVGLAQRLTATELTPEAISSGKLPAMESKAIVRGAVTDCQYCHDDFNSPDFKLESYWPKVQH